MEKIVLMTKGEKEIGFLLQGERAEFVQRIAQANKVDVGQVLDTLINAGIVDMNRRMKAGRKIVLPN